MNIDIPIAAPQQMDEGWSLDPEFLRKIKNSGWVQGSDLEEIEEVLLGLMCVSDRDSALVWHRLSTNAVVRFCTLCSLQVDHNGKPDPRRYDVALIEQFGRGNPYDKCFHRRQPRTPIVVQPGGINSHTFHYTPDNCTVCDLESNKACPRHSAPYDGPEVQDAHIEKIRFIWSVMKNKLDKNLHLE